MKGMLYHLYELYKYGYIDCIVFGMIAVALVSIAGCIYLARLWRVQ